MVRALVSFGGRRNMKELFPAGASFAALLGSAHAADFRPRRQQKRRQPRLLMIGPGFYLGGHVDYGFGWSRWSSTQEDWWHRAARSISVMPTTFPAALVATRLDFTAAMATCPPRVALWVGKPMCRSQISWAPTVPSRSALTGQANYLEQVEYSGSLRGRIGYAPGNWLFYATAGFSL